MTEATHNVGIKIGGDASGAVAAGKQTAGSLEELRKRAEALGVDLAKLEREVAKVTSSQSAYNTILAKTLDAEIKWAQGLGQVTQVAKTAAEETKRFVDNLKEKADTLGKTRAQTEAYRAAQLSLTDAQKAGVAASIRQIEAHDEHEKALGRVKVVALAVTAAAIAYATSTAFAVKGIIDEASELHKLSQSLGISTQGLSAYRYQTSLAGISNQEFSAAMRALAKSVAEAQSGIGDGARLFRLLGAEAEQAAKRGAPIEELLPKIAAAFARMQDSTNKAALANALFKGSGEAMIPLLNQGAAGFTAAAQEAAEFQRIVGPGFARESAEFDRNLTRMNALLDVQKQLLARDLVPALNRYLNLLIEAAKLEGGSLVKGFLIASAAGAGTREQQIARLEAQRAKLTASGADPDMARIDLPIIERALTVARAQPSAWEKEFAEQQARYGRIEKTGVSGRAGPRGQSDNERLIEQITRMDALTSARVDSTEQLTEAERALYTVQALYEAGLTTLGPKEFEQRQEELAAIAVKQRLIAAREREAKAVTDASKAYEQSARALDREAKQGEDANAKLAAHNAEIGLTTEQLGVLKIARAEDALAIARQNAALDQLRDGEDAYSLLVTERVRQAEEFVRLTREGAVLSAGADRAKKEAEEFKRNADSIERSLTDALMRGFEGGKDAGRNFWDAMKNMARTVVLRPLIQPMVEPLGKLGAGLAKEFGGVLGGLVKGMFGASAGSEADWYPVGHTGGVIGVDALPGRMLPALAFAGAPRMHGGGIAGDEVPTILRKDEGVFTPAQMRRLAPVEAAAPSITYSPNVTIDARGADAGVEQRLRESFGAMLYQHRRQIAGLVDEAGKARGRRVMA